MYGMFCECILVWHNWSPFWPFSYYQKEREKGEYTVLYTMYERENDTEMSLVDYISGPNTWATGEPETQASFSLYDILRPGIIFSFIYVQIISNYQWI